MNTAQLQRALHDADGAGEADTASPVTDTIRPRAAAQAGSAIDPAPAGAAGGNATAQAPVRGQEATVAIGQGGRWLRMPAEPLTIAARWLEIERRRAGEPVRTLARRYPHALNRIAATWDDPVGVLDAIDDLLVDRRGGRRGLPTEALAEILSLRLFCEARASDRKLP
jgi:hypothetical protein